MVKAILDHIQTNYVYADEASKKQLSEIDRNTVIHLMQTANTAHDDPYSQWFYQESREALRTDPDRIILMSTINSCIASVTKPGTPRAFKNMSTYQIFHTLYSEVLKEIGEHSLFNYQKPSDNPFDKRWGSLK